MTRLEFDWDPAKARTNEVKHGVTFVQAMEIFADPFARSRLDDDPAIREERWVTLGRARANLLLLVVHTQVEPSSDRIIIRIISARPATRREARQYEEGQEA